MGSAPIGKAYTRNAWAQHPSDWHVWDQSFGDASAKYDGRRENLEAVSICNNGISSNRSDARATYRWTSGVTGIANVKPVGQFWGQLVAYPAAGDGGGEAKITMAIKDITNGDALSNLTLYKEEPPEYVEDFLAKGEGMEKREKGTALDGSDTIIVQQGHTYEAEIKLWTSCWSSAAYSVRVDFSRHTIDSPSDPLIGMLHVNYLQVTMINTGE